MSRVTPLAKVMEFPDCCNTANSQKVDKYKFDKKGFGLTHAHCRDVKNTCLKLRGV